MNILRVLLWLAAISTAGAAFAWATVAARLPESIAVRRLLGECVPQWDFQSLMVFDGEPAHLGMRLVQLSLLQLPGVTLQWTAMANAGLAVLLALVLARLLRRHLDVGGLARPLLLLITALLACSPAFGANWLHGERVGRFAVPLLFVTSLLLLAPGRRFAGRALLVLLLVAIAPLCHARGATVVVALVPALLATGRTKWLITLLVVGIAAAVVSFYPAGHFELAPQGLFGALFSAPGATIDDFLRTTGGMWPDFFANRTIDERMLGLASWMTPALLLWRPAPKAAGELEGSEPVAPVAPPSSDGVWWSCVAFGLVSVVFHHERHGMSFVGDPGLGTQVHAELLYGGFLLPIGVAGLFASRIGTALWPIAGGALIVLSLQGWERGVDTLRAARAAVDHVETVTMLPESLAGPRDARELPTRDIGELQLLEQRGWVPRSEGSWVAIIEAAVNASPDPDRGTLAGGAGGELHGTAPSVLWGPQVSCVVIGIRNSEEPFRAIGYSLPLPSASRRELVWSFELGAAIGEGAQVRAVGLDLHNQTAVRLGPTLVMRDGALVVTAGG